MKTRIFNLIILDESGSMYSIKKEAVDGVNETIQTIKAAKNKYDNQEHFVTLVTFNTETKTIYDCQPINEVQELTGRDYTPNCCTALYDAMGMSLNNLRKNVADNDRVLVTVITDGLENASREYSGNSISEIVKELKNKGWVFAYIGANQDVVKVAASISITNTMSFVANSAGTKKMMNEERCCRSSLFERMNDLDFCAEEENKNFFRKNK